MKTTHLKVTRPCHEKLEGMTPTKNGFYCDSCSKTVVDLTRMNSNQIIKLINQSNQEICGILTEEQLNTPHLYITPNNSFRFPHIKRFTGLLLLATFFNTQSLVGQDILYTPYSPTPYHLVPLSNKDHKYIEKEIPKPIETISLKGQITYQDYIFNTKNGLKQVDFTKYDTTYIEQAKIELITLEGIYSTYSDSNGEYSLDVPKSILKEKNIVHVSYNDIVLNKLDSNAFLSLENENYILTQEEFKEEFNVWANRSHFMVGGIRHIISGSFNRVYYYNGHFFNNFSRTYEVPLPIILYNGYEINYNEYRRAKNKKSNYYKLETKKVHYLRSSYAKILFGPRARYGLYYYYD